MWAAGSSSQEELEPGDLIEISRLGYSHWGVYVGDGNLIHVTRTDEASGSSPFSFLSSGNKNGLVKEEPLSKVAEGGHHHVNNKYDKKYGHKPRDQIVREAKAKVGEKTKYDAFINNCEHFASEMRNGVPRSKQGDAGIEAVFGDYWASHFKEERKRKFKGGQD